MSDACPSLEASSVVGTLSGRPECLPRDTSRAIDPRLFRFGIAAGCLPLLDNIFSSFPKSRIDSLQLFLALNLDAKMIQSGIAPARGDGEIHTWVFKHPLGIVFLDDRWPGRKQG